ncbi:MULTISPECIES: DUF333 domain-containing protein [Moraxella]|uniref:Hemolysin n=1 Tax=Moraxella lacunata TaxID=477 RepID=A0A1B8Q800_MORLA|nr:MULTISPECIES: DUF333 domain-containing protein [Moraxella]MBE9579474.1 DUF333 domain-containing protein [Moraxella sp. K1664]MBE9588839.1 DUF333 domain-containing protein [Moraxella sp. K1630]MBE9591799.1 DUF333 domain-containing protein [Moraxella sp. K127]MBE9597051.1 DUF333 domain-containing protein [Moraxella sp. K2450]MDH9219629.1 DUF333 domain-containing protein [Moraxella lacunata]
MKTITLLGIAMTTLTLTACTTTNQAQSPAVGMANPASEFCTKQGGKTEIRKNADGSEYGVCHLPNGQVVEEWEFFRQHQK